MKHPKPSSRFGLFGALLAWGAYFLFLFRGLTLVFILASETGSPCATVRLSARENLIEIIPWFLLPAGIGWGIAHFSKSFVRTGDLVSLAVPSHPCSTSPPVNHGCEPSPAEYMPNSPATISRLQKPVLGTSPAPFCM